ncbi:MAG: hypothetical protein RL007_54 [Bacteroidota bacterium]
MPIHRRIPAFALRKNILFSVLILFVSMLNAQSFPDQFIGNWKGKLNIYQGPKLAQTINVALDVMPLDSGRYDWVITYGDSGKDVRPYMLIPVDTAKGHWAIDEKDGIVLDIFVTGKKFTSTFAVMGSAVQVCYWIEGEELCMEIWSFNEKPDHKSGLGTEEVPEVNVYKFSGYHFAKMQKVKGKK